jgi:hypothetical protein
MTLVQNNFDGGTQGVTITQGSVGNSGGASGDFFNTITGPFVFDATGARFFLGGRVQIASSTAWRSYHQWTAVSQVAGRFVFSFNTSVVNSVSVGGSVGSSTFATAVRFATGSSGQFAVLNAAGSTIATSSALSANTLYVLEYQVAPGTATNNGTIQVQFYTWAAVLAAGGTPSGGSMLINFATTTGNAGGATNPNISRGQLGNNDTVTSLDITFDDIVYNTGTLNPIGAPPIPASVPAPQLSVMRTEVISRSHGRLTNR